MKGIILAGGSGTRLHPLTLVVSKQLLPIYDKPMIYYPLSVLMLAGIREILIISTPNDLPNFKYLFGNGEQLGLKISYKEQPSPDGLAQAFILGEEFIGDDNVCLVLGDNIFFGSGFKKVLRDSLKKVKKDNTAIIFGNYVEKPERFGIAEVDKDLNVISLEEKPSNPKSNFAVVGLYFYPNSVVEIAKNIKPSDRGELEITSVNEEYLKNNNLSIKLLNRGFAWIDTGTLDSLSEATEFVKAVEKRTALKIGCVEEIALSYNWISKDILSKSIENKKGNYYEYLRKIIKQKT